jgi:putative methyltransferase
MAPLSPSSSPYHPAASLLNEVWTKRRSLKSLAYDPEIGTMTCSKTAYAQASNVLRIQDSLDKLVIRNPFAEVLGGFRNRGLLFVLLHELLEGPNRKIRGGGSIRRALLEMEPALRAAWDELRAAANKNDNTEASRNRKESRKAWADDGEEDDDNDESGGIDAQQHPRYVRVNTLTSSVRSVTEMLRVDLRISCDHDEHIPDLLVVESKDAATTEKLVRLTPDVVLQDKSSCFPAYCLVHGFSEHPSNQGRASANNDYLDACAAPGNKTLHLAALVASSAAATAAGSTLSGRGERTTTIYGLDKDERRCHDLKRRINQHVKREGIVDPSFSPAVKVRVACRDFLSVRPNEYRSVGAILLDPTCSGSGCVGGDRPNQQGSNEERLQSLSRFQTNALLHAMSFPNCRRIVYSTCSVHDAENEHVVATALKQQQDEEGSEWALVAPRCLSGWRRRGRVVGGLTLEQADALVRVDPRKDRTGGFFVACFERTAQRSIRTRRSNDPPQPGSHNKRPATIVRGQPSDESTETRVKRLKRTGPLTSTDGSGNALPCAYIAVYSKHCAGLDVKYASPALPKKRLKKLQWKQKQREEKHRRVLRKKEAS